MRVRRRKEQSLAHSAGHPLLATTADERLLQIRIVSFAACHCFRYSVPLHMVCLEMIACAHDKKRMGACLGEKASACCCQLVFICSEEQESRVTYQSP